MLSCFSDTDRKEVLMLIIRIIFAIGVAILLVGVVSLAFYCPNHPQDGAIAVLCKALHAAVK